MTPEDLQAALANPAIALDTIEKIESERKLIDFIRNGWKALEPGQPFVAGWAIEAICDHLQAVTEGEIRRLLINVPPGCTKPGALDNPVITSCGIIPLGDIIVGDSVLTHKGRYKPVTATHEQGILPLLQITTDGGRVTKPALDHSYLTHKGWIQAKDLKIDDILATVSPIEDSDTTALTPDIIVEIKVIEPEECRCLTVEDDHSMTWDGLAVHNSMSTSVFWPAWEWGPRNLPHYRYILAAHEQNLAIRDNVRGRDLIHNEWYQKHWGDHVSLKEDVRGKINYQNTLTGWRMASSVGSGLVGYRGDRLILDDPHSIKKADSDAFREEVLRWFSETLPTRLNKLAESAIVIIMQRVHERDVSGLILAEELGYEHLMLPMEFEKERRCYSYVKPSYIKNPKKVKVAWDEHHKSWIPDDNGTKEKYCSDSRTEDGDLLWPERFSAESVEELKKALRSWGGSYAEAGQLQQRPAPRGGGMFQKDDFIIVDSVPEGGRTVRGWDLAATDAKKNKKAAFTVGCKITLVKGGIYIEDIDRKQVGPSGVEKMILTNSQMDGHSVLQDLPQDPGSSGKAQKFAIAKLLHGYNFSFSVETGSKEDRAIPLAAQCESGNLYLLKGNWNQNFINESALFPNGQFKDQIDAASRAYSALLRKRRRLIGAGPTIIK